MKALSTTIYGQRGPVTVDAILSESAIRSLAFWLEGQITAGRITDYQLDEYPERMTFGQIRQQIENELS